MPKHKKIHGHVPGPQQPTQNLCFACGPDNPDGMHLKFALDEANKKFICKFRLPKKFWGPPKHCHGGIVATILDEAMGKVNKIHDIIAMTRSMEIDYLRPSPLGQPLTLTGKFVRRDGRKVFMEAELRNAADDLLVRSKGLFIAIDPAKFFAKHSKERVSAACPVAVPAETHPHRK